MGLYSFKPQFTPHILSGRKKHTIRAKRKDGWVEKPGNTMYLYENVRTKQRKHIGNTKCARVEPIKILMEYCDAEVALPWEVSVFIADVELTSPEKEQLAYTDGFENWEEMVRYWDGELPFEGFLIHWKVAPSNGHYADREVWETWKQKLGAGPSKIIDILLDRGECTRVQLKTLGGYSSRSMTNIISALNSNQLIEKEGDKIRLRKS